MKINKLCLIFSIFYLNCPFILATVTKEKIGLNNYLLENFIFGYIFTKYIENIIFLIS